LSQIDCLAVLERPGIETNLEKLAEELPGIQGKLRFLTAPEIQISSSEIRRRVRNGNPFKHFLNPEVHRYLVTNEVYSS
jgi:nicotinate-nucleotide adenylyltransferase